MDKFRIRGPTKFQGKVTISSAKSAALSILFAVLLAKEPIETQNTPKSKGVDTSVKLLSQLDAKVGRNGSVHIDARDVNVFCALYDLVKTTHTSIWALGSLVVRFGQGQVPLPGGCMIGVCPVDLHVSDLEQLGATIKLGEGYVKASVDGHLKGAHIVMDKVSAGATVTIMCATTLAGSITIIENAAREPEIVDITNFLIVLDAKTSGQGTNRIVIEGVGRLGGDVYRVLPDHIEAGTSLIAATVSHDKIIHRNAQSDTLDAVLAKLRDTGVDIEVGEDWINLDMHGKRPRAINVHATSHPAFPTDMQAQLTLLDLVAEGTGLIIETVSKNCFTHVPKPNRMGVHAGIESNTVICHGTEKLSDAQVMAIDPRTSANPVLAGYIAEGTTAVDCIYCIDRSYERIEDKLRALGTNIEHMKGEQLSGS